MKTLKQPIMFLIFSIMSVACSQQAPLSVSPLSEVRNDTSLTTLCLTRVKTPWYAWKSLVTGKMLESIPEYQSVKGLKQKFYSFTPNHKYFGGIYLFEKQGDALSWFNQDWFDRTKKKYGEIGLVDYFQIVSIREVAKPNSDKGDFVAVLARTATPANIDSSEGLIKIIQLIDGQGKECYLSLWRDDKAQRYFFKTNPSSGEIFEIPILLINP